MDRDPDAIGQPRLEPAERPWATSGTSGSGDQWFHATDGQIFWGPYGAAGILARHRSEDGTARYLVVRRAAWVHGGQGLWAIPGGARHDGESALEAAVREFIEEMGEPPEGMSEVARHVAEPAPGEWSYVTILMQVGSMPSYGTGMSLEHTDARWVTLDQMCDLTLFAPFRRALHELGLADRSD